MLVDSVSNCFSQIITFLIPASFLDENTDEELCNRWMQLSAFNPFYRNHNANGTLSQEPYRWESVADASRRAISIRYALLPYWVSYICKMCILSLTQNYHLPFHSVYAICQLFYVWDTTGPRALLGVSQRAQPFRRRSPIPGRARYSCDACAGARRFDRRG